MLGPAGRAPHQIADRKIRMTRRDHAPDRRALHGLADIERAHIARRRAIEPASAAGVAALAKLGAPATPTTAVALVTGHGLKDTDAVDQSSSATVDATLEAILEELG